MRRVRRLVLASLIGGSLAFAVATTGHPRAGGLMRARSSSVLPGERASAPLDVVINEVAWMGTGASHADEWIELYNRTDSAVDIGAWSIYGADTGKCLNFSEADGALTTKIPRHGYLIYANHEDDVSDVTGLGLVAIWDASIGMNNVDPGEVVLYDAAGCAGNVVDVVNQASGDWFAGDSGERKTMERKRPGDSGADQANWSTNDPGLAHQGYDADGDPISGTPKAQNSCYEPPSVPVADLSIVKHGASSVRPGDCITYRITLSNAGTTTANGTVVTDALPAGVTFVTQISTFTFSTHGRRLIWELGDVPVGSASRITAVGSVSTAVSYPGALVNVVTATTASSETATSDNSALCTTTLEPPHVVLLPMLVRNYAPPRYGVIIEAALYNGLQAHDYDEAVLLVNGSYRDVDLTGWQLCKRGAPGWTCAHLPSMEIEPRGRLWLARNPVHFARSFGFALEEEQVLSSWPRLSNDGEELALRDADGACRDVLVYKRGLTEVDGWEGQAVQPYLGASFAEEGQILYRRLDEGTGLPADDTDTAADWAQYAEDPCRGRRVRYPGWDLEQFFQPAVGTSGTITAAIAPDNAYDLVIDTIRSARETIGIEAYTLEHYGLVTELVERAREGVTVTVLLEGGPVGGVEDQELWACQQLHATGRGTCALMVNDTGSDVYDRYTYLHAKFMVVDRKRLLLGSQNLAHSGLPGDEKRNGTGGSRGVVLLTNVEEMVARAVDVFEADCDPAHHADVRIWPTDSAGAPPPGFRPDPGRDWVTYTVQFPKAMAAAGTGFELVTAPEAALRSSDALLGLIARAGAGDAVFVEQLYERLHWGDSTDAPNPRLQAYVEAARRGARVKILLNGGAFDLDFPPLTENTETVAYVNEIAQREGLDLSAHLADPTHYGIHNKMVLVDLAAEGKYAHVGSINGSETSNKVNREMALQVRSEDLFDYLYAAFAYDWNHQLPRDTCSSAR